MKRSEMITKIHTKLVGTPITELASGDDFAEKLLTFIEDLGMLPPSCEFQMGNSIVKDNCWESENEA